MQDQLRALVKLAEIDGAARDLKRELAELPATVREMEADVARLERMLETERAELDEARGLKASHEGEISHSNEMLGRAKAKGAKARNAREVEAAEREMDAARRSIKEREEEQERLQQAIASKEESLSGRQSKLEEFRALFAEESEKATARIAVLDGQVKEVTAGRDDVAEKIPKAILKRYERIQTRHANVVVPVQGGTCQGCRLQIPPQQFNELQRGESVEQCPHCLRFIYVEALLAD